MPSDFIQPTTACFGDIMILKNLIQSLVAVLLLVGFIATANARDIVHDAEY